MVFITSIKTTKKSQSFDKSEYNKVGIISLKAIQLPSNSSITPTTYSFVTETPFGNLFNSETHLLKTISFFLTLSMLILIY
jgi:hypothetical protein